MKKLVGGVKKEDKVPGIVHPYVQDDLHHLNDWSNTMAPSLQCIKV